MKKGVIKGIVLTLIFVIAALVFGTLTSQKNVNLTTDMEEANLPVVYLYENDVRVNELFGYTTEMNALYMRDDITPLADNLVLPVEVQTYGAEVAEISYEVRSINTERLIEDTTVTDYTEENDCISANLQIQNLLDDNTEYLLIITLKTDTTEVHYYSRIMKATECNVTESVDFAVDFHNQTMNYDESTSTLATYLEPDSTGNNSTLNKVTINSSLSQVTWADFTGEQFGDLNVSIKEINTSYNVIMIDYVMTSTGENGEIEYYNVEEYYRVRYTTDRVYLLNYERTMNEIFGGENGCFYDNYVQLGIRDEDVEYKKNENGDIVCFVQEGELWSYDESEDELARVFSFRSLEGIDVRENNSDHDIKIINVDEEGSIDFVVYGYMSRGSHEGEVGTCVYHYDSVANTIEEELYIPSNQSYQVMKESFGELMYESDDNIFYLMLEGDIYKIDLGTKESEQLITGLVEGSYSISDSNQYVAWNTDESLDAATEISILNLETGEQFTVSADSGTYIKPLGFLDTDFIYGIANQQDVTQDQSGNTVFPMRSVKIIDAADSAHEVLKDYTKDGYYVSGIQISGNTIYLNRLQFNGTAYVAANQDTIKNNEESAAETETDIATTVTDVRQTQVQLSVSSEISDTTPKVLTPKEVVVSDDINLALELENTKSKYYAYAKGEVVLATTSLSEAIQAANEEMGVVVGSSQEYIWKRAKKTSQTAINVSVSAEETSGENIAQTLSSLLEVEEMSISTSALLQEGHSAKDILTDTMKDAQVLDLTGCSVEEVLYYVNLGNPVYALNSGSTAVLITGYDSSNVILFNAVTGESERMTLTDADALFTSVGNVFIGYIN